MNNKPLLPDKFEELIAAMDKGFKELGERNAAAKAKEAEENPEQAKCDHGVVFDLEEAKRILDTSIVDEDEDPALAFIMGPSATPEIRKRFPRLCGECPKGCGYNGIAYASFEHYTYGDW